MRYEQLNVGLLNMEGHIIPTVSMSGTTYPCDLGSSTYKFRHCYFSGNASVGGTLGVTGNTTLSGTLAVTGATSLNGDVDIGNAAADTVAFFGAAGATQQTVADPAAATSSDAAFNALTFSATVVQAEAEALRDEAKKGAADARVALAKVLELVNALQAHGLISAT